MTGVTGPTTAAAGEPAWDALGAWDEAELEGFDDLDECDDWDEDWASAGATPSARAAAARTQVFNMSLSFCAGRGIRGAGETPEL
jgi:hypothetical protein